MLKSPCVELSQVASRYQKKGSSAKDLINSSGNLLKTLTSISNDDVYMDTKLADYAFFPLIPIFRNAKNFPVRAAEIATRCLRLLITHGWRAQLPADVGKQLLILLCFIAGGSATESDVKEVNEELGSAAFECLEDLFRVSRGFFLGRPSIHAENVPLLGHSVTVMLDGVADGPSAGVRLTALAALSSMIESVSDHEALRNVLPGIVSTLTKALSPKIGTKQTVKFVTASLAVLTKVLCKVVGDDRVGSSNDARQGAIKVTENTSKETQSWAVATAAQIKMALANILPLRHHERPEVRSALLHLCISLIQECRTSLSESIPILIETLLALCSQAASDDESALTYAEGILVTDAGLIDIAKGSLHDWIIALPRVMQSNDDARKTRIAEQIFTAFKILESQEINLDMLNELLSISLQASVQSAMQASTKMILPTSDAGTEVTQILQGEIATSKSTVFSSVLFSESSNRNTIGCLQKLAMRLRLLPASAILQRGITTSLRNATADEQLASLWLSIQLVQDSVSEDLDLDQFLDMPSDQEGNQPMLDEVYSFSLDVLAESTFEDEDHWQLQALSLEAIALQARQQKLEFRPELVDALYPILERLGSSNVALQQHAMTCLNMVSDACDYPNAAALIIDNADYLVNAIALKLNTFDISIQAPQILVMMIKLCGSALIPYLDDLIESIFSILACYHGYPKLVESLFSVLNAIIEEAAKSLDRSIKPTTDTTTRPQPYRPLSLDDLASILRSNRERADRPLSPPSSPPPEPSSDTPPSNREEDPEAPPPPDPSASPPPPAPTKTHTLLISITALTPAHLTTPSAPLRAHILTLLSTAFPLLATNTNTFLPQAATLWHPISARLTGDSEPYVILAAAKALGALCEAAGDFLRTRAEDEWEGIRRVYEAADCDRAEEQRVQGPRGRGMRWRVWDAVVGLLMRIVTDVGVSADMEDDIFEMFGPWVGERGDVRSVLEGLNADALWLVEERARRAMGAGVPRKPRAPGGMEFKDADVWVGGEVKKKGDAVKDGLIGRGGRGGSALKSLKLDGEMPGIRIR